MPASNQSRNQLDDIRNVIAPLDVGPLMDDNTIEFISGKVLDERRGNSDHRQSAPDPGPCRFLVRKSQVRRPSPFFHPRPMAQSFLDRGWKCAHALPGPHDSHDPDREPYAVHADPYTPHVE